VPDDFDIQWNGERILGALSEPFHRANEALNPAFAKELTSRKWDWPGETKRENGEVVSSPRDIVDTGELRRSYVGKREGPFEHSHSWSNIEYGMAVHEGADFSDGRKMPARPWTRDPIKQRVLEEAFERYVGPELGKIQ